MGDIYIQVHIGKNYEVEVGELVYFSTEVTQGGLNTGILVIIVIGILVVVAVLLLAFVLKKKRMGPCADPHEKSFRYVQGEEGLDTEGRRLMDQNRQNGTC